MNKKLRLLSMTILLILSITNGIFADTRTENIELYLVIDKSKSMVEEITDVSAYINETFIENFLISGDRLVLIQFYGKADLIYDGIISDSEKTILMNDLSNIPADGRFTDIGNALDRLDTAVRSASGRSERKYLILLTDGKQEAPPESPYYTPDGSFNHEFLENTKVIQRAGWKVMILGIGQETAVEELAEELGTTSEILDFSEESRPEAKSAAEIIGRILASDFSIIEGELKFSLKSEGYADMRTIIIEQITYQLPGGNYDLLSSPETIEIEPGEKIATGIELADNKLIQLDDNETSGSIIFKFSGDTPFLPAVFDSVLISAADSADGSNDKKVSEKSENSGNNEVNWLIVVIVILIVAAVIAFFIIRNLIFHRDEDEGNKKKKDEISVDR
ncbi:MAG TPA: hypothetical protein DCO79_14435 [Spirochaeta sp.]|nr:hypothetical protein [Spirochaeta sp.]